MSQTNYLSETNFSSKINYSDIPFQVDCKEVSYSAVHGSLEHAPNYILHIHPPAILHNYLPYSIQYASPVSRKWSNTAVWATVSAFK